MKINLLLGFLLLSQTCLNAQSTRENPLMPKLNQPIQFGKVTTTDITEATKLAIADAKRSLAAIYAIPKGKHNFTNTILATDNFSDKLGSVYYGINILLNASPKADLREEALRSVQLISNFNNEVALDEKLYQAIKEYAKTKEATQLTGARKRYLKDQIDSYERDGFALTAEKRKELEALNNKINKLEVDFGTNIATYKDQLLVKHEDMAGLPDDYVKSRRKEGDNYIITLDGPSYSTFMKFADSDDMRKALFVKYNNRSADKNLEVLKNLLIEREKKAKLLGYPTYAAYIASDRMVKNTATVWDFENDLVEKVREKTQQDVNELLEVKRKHVNDPSIAKLNGWDASYYSNKLMVDKYQVNSEVIKEYFALNNVIDGLFKVTQQLFGISYVEVKNPSVWHDDTRMFEVQQHGKVIGRFYLDLHPRDNKYTHAACFGIRKGKQYSSAYQIPTAALLCNFNAPTADKPALLSHSQAVTFFHEFGHVLHNMLTTAELAGQSGPSVKRDFVEAPSQIFENWVWNYDALKLFAKHYKTGEVLPLELFKKMDNAKNVGSGIGASGQLFYGILDYTLHDKFDPNGSKSSTEVVKELQNRIMPYDYVEGTNMHAAFGHLTGYGASYYSYLWSKVYAEDMFSVFEKNGVMDQKTGLQYRVKILAKGGSEDELKMVKDFLGRDPDRKAFLKSLGL